MTPNIRFIIDSSHDGAFNMAADQYLLRQSVSENQIIIRFYTWSVPTITIGYMQKPALVLDTYKMVQESVGWVRRPTGGRAVMHYEDLTYSCMFPKSLKFMGSTVRESYNLITKCLLRGLGYAGISCEAHDSYDQLLEVKREVKLPCFLAPNRDEVMVNGKKLIGSAQRRVTDSILQHGSMPLTDYYRKLPHFLKLSQKEQISQSDLLKKKSICIRELDKTLDIDTLVESLKKGFADIFNLDCTDQKFTNDELQTIEKESKSEGFIKRWLE
ncbi:MAG: lipoate--protein ligase family protein [Fibrobacter sp.]|nr:lipoate--protein ligase family protein [Fibrobacter sp.]